MDKPNVYLTLKKLRINESHNEQMERNNKTPRQKKKIETKQHRALVKQRVGPSKR